MSQIAKHYELARHHALAGQSYDADLPDGVRNGITHEMERLTNAGLGERILSVTNASATDLSFIPDESCDAVLMLGPFYHLSLPEERQQAAQEARRVLRNGGLIFAAGINIMTMLSWIYSDGPENILDDREWLAPYVKTGNFQSPEPGVPPTIHMTTSAEFRADFTNFHEIALGGVESFAQWHEENLLKLSPEQADAWLDLIEEAGRTPEGLGMTYLETHREGASPPTEDFVQAYFETYQKFAILPTGEFVRRYLERYKEKLFLIRNTIDREHLLELHAKA
jgi:SAM-dependent methyltransferase